MSAYVHPPFVGGGWGYDRTATRADWLDMMRGHVRSVHELLAPDGSVWIFLDDDGLADCRPLLDKVFGRSNFVATVVVRRPSGSPSSRHLAISHDYLLVYAKNASMWTSNRIPRTGGPDSRYRNPDNDPRGVWTSQALTTSRNYGYSAGRYEVTSPSGTTMTPRAGFSWRFSRERFEELDRDNRVWWREGFIPTLKRFFSELPDPMSLTTWEPAEVGSFRDGRRELRELLPAGPDHAAPDPEQLLHRVITLSSKPGDLVFDCFSRAGTAAAVAHKMGRRWISVADESYDVRPRLDKVVTGEDPGGVTELVGWSGGGSYEAIDVEAPTTVQPERTISFSEALADGRVPRLAYAYREDGNNDLATRLADGCVLREGREAEWARATRPRLFVLCEEPGEMDEAATVLRREHCLPDAGDVVRAADGLPCPDVRAVIGRTDDLADVPDVTVIVSYHPLSPEQIGHLLPALSGDHLVEVVVHGTHERLLASHDRTFDVRIPVPTRPRHHTRPVGGEKRTGLASILFPLRVRVAQGERFSLSHITDQAARAAGATVRHEFPVPLVRQELYSERTSAGGIARGVRPLEPDVAVERFVAVAEVRSDLEGKVHRLVDSAPAEVNGAKRIAGQFLLGAGATSDEATWSRRRRQLAITAVTKLVTGVRKSRQPGSQWEWRPVTLPSAIPSSKKPKNHWTGFSKGTPSDGWTKSLDPAVRFDAKSTELEIARLCEQSPSVAGWLGLNGQLVYIEMENGARYHPDFVVVDAEEVHWLVEAKADRDAGQPDVRAKREAAEEWTTFVRDHGGFGDWRHLFVTESLIGQSLSWDELVARAQPLL